MCLTLLSRSSDFFRLAACENALQDANFGAKKVAFLIDHGFMVHRMFRPAETTAQGNVKQTYLGSCKKGHGLAFDIIVIGLDDMFVRIVGACPSSCNGSPLTAKGDSVCVMRETKMKYSIIWADQGFLVIRDCAYASLLGLSTATTCVAASEGEEPEQNPNPNPQKFRWPCPEQVGALV